jgi:hypothetical protein
LKLVRAHSTEKGMESGDEWLRQRQARILRQAAEKVESVTSAAKAADGNKGFIAALKALRHPKPDFSVVC